MKRIKNQIVKRTKYGQPQSSQQVIELDIENIKVKAKLYNRK